jgi:hypothetical protein
MAAIERALDLASYEAADQRFVGAGGQVGVAKKVHGLGTWRGSDVVGKRLPKHQDDYRRCPRLG